MQQPNLLFSSFKNQIFPIIFEDQHFTSRFCDNFLMPRNYRDKYVEEKIRKTILYQKAAHETLVKFKWKHRLPVTWKRLRWPFVTH